METKTTFKELYSFTGFRACSRLKTYPDDSEARVVVVNRRQKKRYVPVVENAFMVSATAEHTQYVTWMPQIPVFMWNLNTDGYTVRTVKP